MFGKAPNNVRQRVEVLAIEVGWPAQALELDGMHFDGFTIKYSDHSVNRKLYSMIEDYVEQLPDENSERLTYAESIRTLAESNEDPNERHIGIACYFFVVACIKCSLLFKAIDRYPRDKKLRQLAYMALQTLSVSLSIVFPACNDELQPDIVETAKFGPVPSPSKDAREILSNIPGLLPALTNSSLGY